MEELFEIKMAEKGRVLIFKHPQEDVQFHSYSSAYQKTLATIAHYLHQERIEDKIEDYFGVALQYKINFINQLSYENMRRITQELPEFIASKYLKNAD
jgi:hypothetical protein